MATFHKLKIASVTRETPKAVKVSFDVPEHLKADFNFKAGQYITLKTEINNETVRRDYSLCTNPESGVIAVAIKEVEGGAFSVLANQSLAAGDEIDVSTPNGRFIYTPETSSETIFGIAAGSGITPVMGILKTVLKETSNSKFVLLFGNKSEQDTIFKDELTALSNEFSDRFSVQYLFSQEQKEYALSGRINEAIINATHERLNQNTNASAYYICGPEAMINSAKNTLVARGVSEESIKYELFTSSSSEPTAVPESDSQSAITIIVDDETFEIESDAKSTVLDLALKEDIDVPYSCKGGICSSCIARITEGTATMAQNNILTESEVAEGLILTCQAHATSEKVVIDYDDV